MIFMMTNLVTKILAVHLAALSQVESNDRDDKVGPSGEVSRYQILPVVWRREAALERLKADSRGLAFVEPSANNPAQARAVARTIWENRVEMFRLAHRRGPSLTELYLLWNKPRRVLNPRRTELDRAKRFENLAVKLDTQKSSTQK